MVRQGAVAEWLGTASSGSPLGFASHDDFRTLISRRAFAAASGKARRGG
jgi:hypothetical protein